MIAASQLRLLVFGCCAFGCASSERGPVFATSSSFPVTARRPPSLATQTGERASSSWPEGTHELQKAVVPLDSESARAVVSRFFMAVLLESSSELFPLLSGQCMVLSEGNRQPAQALWRSRLAQLDYASLAGRVIAPPQALRTYTFATAERARRDGVLVPGTPSEVVIVATPALSWSGKTRLFGDQLAFRLKAKQSEPAYEIAEIAEDFRLP